jgi:hypothetical protein
MHSKVRRALMARFERPEDCVMHLLECSEAEAKELLAMDAKPRARDGVTREDINAARHLSGQALAAHCDHLDAIGTGDIPAERLTEDDEEESAPVNIEIETEQAEGKDETMREEEDDYSHDEEEGGHEEALAKVERYLRRTGHWNDETLGKIHRYRSRHRLGAEEEGEAEDRMRRRRGRDNALWLPSNATQALAGRINSQLPRRLSGAAPGVEPAAEPLLRRHAHDAAEDFASFVKHATDRVVGRGFESGVALNAGSELERRAPKGPPSAFCEEVLARIKYA